VLVLSAVEGSDRGVEWVDCPTNVPSVGINLIIFNNYKKQADPKKWLTAEVFAFYMPYLGSNFILRFQQVSSIGKIDRGKKVLKKFINGQKVFSEGGNKRCQADWGPRQDFILPE